MLGILVYFSHFIQSLYYVIWFKTIWINFYHFTKILHTSEIVIFIVFVTISVKREFTNIIKAVHCFKLTSSCESKTNVICIYK